MMVGKGRGRDKKIHIEGRVAKGRGDSRRSGNERRVIRVGFECFRTFAFQLQSVMDAQDGLFSRISARARALALFLLANVFVYLSLTIFAPLTFFRMFAGLCV